VGKRDGVQLNEEKASICCVRTARRRCHTSPEPTITCHVRSGVISTGKGTQGRQFLMEKDAER